MCDKVIQLLEGIFLYKKQIELFNKQVEGITVANNRPAVRSWQAAQPLKSIFCGMF